MKRQISFTAKDNPGNALGQYDSYVDISVAGTEIHFVVPEGWEIMNVNIYDSGESSDKTSNIASLRGNFNQTVWNMIFSRAFPAGFSFKSGNDRSTIIDSGAASSSYDYLIRIYNTDTTTNDFIDPGLRNTF